MTDYEKFIEGKSQAQREQLGYFEEYLLDSQGGVVFPKCLGILLLKDNPSGRLLGFAGRLEMTLTRPIELVRGHKTVIYKASNAKPLKVVTMLQRLEGRDV